MLRSLLLGRVRLGRRGRDRLGRRRPLRLRGNRIGLFDHGRRVGGRRRRRLLRRGLRERRRRRGSQGERRRAIGKTAPAETARPPSTAPRAVRQSLWDCDTPAWLSAAEKLGLAISAAMFGCAASAASAFWLRRQGCHRGRLLADRRERLRVAEHRREGLRDWPGSPATRRH